MPLPGVLDEEPFERRVFLVLASALTLTRRAADAAVATGNMDGFQQGVPRGVSANLCEAVAGMGEDSIECGVNFHFTWAGSRPPTGDVIQSVVFPPDILPVIREAARLLRAAAPPEEVEIYGYVVKLERGLHEDRGQVTVVTEIHDSLRHIRLELDGDAYRVAIQAHDAVRAVTCRGVLAKEGTTFVLRNPHDMVIEFESMEP